MVWMLLFSLPTAWVMRHSPIWQRPFWTAAIWVGFEQTHLIGDLAFPWNFLGHSLAVPPMLSIAQWAAAGGVGLLSFFIALTNASLANMLFALRHPEGLSRSKSLILNKPPFRQALFTMIVTFLILFCAMIIGATRMENIRLKNTYKLLKVAIIQPNIQQLDKNAYYINPTRELEEKILGPVWESLDRLTSSGIDLCILPESTAPYFGFVYQEGLRKRFEQAANAMNADIVLGADNREVWDNYYKRYKKGQFFGKEGRNRMDETSRTLPTISEKDGELIEESDHMATFVSAWHVLPKSGFSHIVYDKMRLVPFGESAPLLGHIPGFNRFIMQAGTFQTGTHQVQFETKNIKYAPLICYESCFPHLARGIAQAGGQMLVVITNDAWYNPAHLGKDFTDSPFLKRLAGAGPEQHMRQTVMRAIETNLPAVRAAQTGISTLISSTGQILRNIPSNQKGIIIAYVPDMPGRDYSKNTFYTRFGDWPGTTGLVIIMSIFVIVFVKRRQNKSKTSNSTVDENLEK